MNSMALGKPVSHSLPSNGQRTNGQMVDDALQTCGRNYSKHMEGSASAVGLMTNERSSLTISMVVAVRTGWKLGAGFPKSRLSLKVRTVASINSSVPIATQSRPLKLRFDDHSSQLRTYTSTGGSDE